MTKTMRILLLLIIMAAVLSGCGESEAEISTPVVMPFDAGDTVLVCSDDPAHVYSYPCIGCVGVTSRHLGPESSPPPDGQ